LRTALVFLFGVTRRLCLWGLAGVYNRPGERWVVHHVCVGAASTFCVACTARPHDLVPAWPRAVHQRMCKTRLCHPGNRKYARAYPCDLDGCSACVHQKPLGMCRHLLSSTHFAVHILQCEHVMQNCLRPSGLLLTEMRAYVSTTTDSQLCTVAISLSHQTPLTAATQLALLANTIELAGYLHTLTLCPCRHCKLNKCNRPAFQTSTDALKILVHEVHRQCRALLPLRCSCADSLGAAPGVSVLPSTLLPCRYIQRYCHVDPAAM